MYCALNTLSVSANHEPKIAPAQGIAIAAKYIEMERKYVKIV